MDNKRTIGKSIAQIIAEELVSVQPMDGSAFKYIMDNAKSSKELAAEGYVPVSQLGLMWVKKDG